MRKLLLVSLLCCILASTACAGGSKQLSGNIPTGWKPIELTGIDVSLALPADWEVWSTQAGYIEFSASHYIGSVTVNEAVPATKLSLLRLMSDHANAWLVPNGIVASLSEDGYYGDPPVHWAVFSNGVGVQAVVGAAVTDQGTILLRSGFIDPSAQEQARNGVLELARTLRSDARALSLK